MQCAASLTELALENSNIELSNCNRFRMKDCPVHAFWKQCHLNRDPLCHRTEGRSLHYLLHLKACQRNHQGSPCKKRQDRVQVNAWIPRGWGDLRKLLGAVCDAISEPAFINMSNHEKSPISVLVSGNHSSVGPLNIDTLALISAGAQGHECMPKARRILRKLSKTWTFVSDNA